MMSNDEPLDERYLTWLYGLVGPVSVRRPSSSHWLLMSQFYTKEFFWFVPNDDNRVADGLELRDEWIIECGIVDADEEWMTLGCSMLEMMIALARRASFETEMTSAEWFWRFTDNLVIGHYTNQKYNEQVAEEVDYILTRVIERTYAENGAGGFFPLHNSPQDQREVELWYQLSAYILEGG